MHGMVAQVRGHAAADAGQHLNTGFVLGLGCQQQLLAGFCWPAPGHRHATAPCHFLQGVIGSTRSKQSPYVRGEKPWLFFCEVEDCEDGRLTLEQLPVEINLKGRAPSEKYGMLHRCCALALPRLRCPRRPQRHGGPARPAAAPPRATQMGCTAHDAAEPLSSRVIDNHMHTLHLAFTFTRTVTVLQLNEQMQGFYRVRCLRPDCWTSAKLVCLLGTRSDNQSGSYACSATLCQQAPRTATPLHLWQPHS